MRKENSKAFSGHKGCLETMWPVVLQMLRTYAPYVTLPVAAVIGFVGYNIEKHFHKTVPNRPSVDQQREERQLEELLKAGTPVPDPLSKRSFIPETVFEKNVSPSLIKKEEEEK
ncbi:small integral membrane protein 12 [Oratosquilla oratoria]|uniref:small integral membrane protein 12 n=1 Tax=Oratosquilla oratoria TaxID=337810 RepID=UPI003F77105D